MQLIREHVKDFGLLRVVYADEVEKMCNEGWKLIAILNSNEVRSFDSSTPVYRPPDSYGNCGVVEQWPNPMPYTQNIIQFLFGKDERSVIEKLRKELHEKAERVEDLLGAVKICEDTVSERNEYIDTLQARIDRKSADAQATHEELESKRKVINKLENDISKIREYVGSKKFAEIVNLYENI